MNRNLLKALEAGIHEALGMRNLEPDAAGVKRAAKFAYDHCKAQRHIGFATAIRMRNAWKREDENEG